MPWNDHTGPVPDRSPEELLALTRRKADVLSVRRRRHVGMATASAVLLVAALATVVVRSRPESTVEIRTASGDVSTSTTESPSTTTPTTLAVVLPVPLPPTTATSRPTTTAARSPQTTRTTQPSATSTSTVPQVCRNSGDPACGPFRWDPPPGPNQPLTVNVTFTPAAPEAGDTVTFRVVIDDPDGVSLVDNDGRNVDYGDGTPVANVNAHIDCLQGFGPWATPDPEPIHEELVLPHVYTRPGTFTATFPVKSLGDCARGASQATTAVVVVVSP